MAEVKFDKSNFQRVYSKDLTGRILLDLSGAGLVSNKKLLKDFDASNQAVAERLAKVTAEQINQETKAYYNAGISEIQRVLKTGVKGVASTLSVGAPGSISLRSRGDSVDISFWKDLHPNYYRHKPKRTRNLFWKRRSAHGLSAAFGNFAGIHKSAVSRTPISVTLRRKLNKVNRGKTFRYQLNFTLPAPHKGSGYLKDLLQKSFFEGKAHEGFGHGLEGDLAIIGYLEGKSRTTFNKHRPFIGALMASKGNALKERIERLIRTQAV